MAVVDRVRDLVVPLAAAASIDLYDVEHNGGLVRVLVDAADGVDLNRIARLSRAVSRTLDKHDAVPGRYTLEVSSPGLERPLRTPDHFRRAVGSSVKVKTVPGYEGSRRLSGVLDHVDDHGIKVHDDTGDVYRVGYSEVISARTIFEWGPSSRVSGRKPSGQPAGARSRPSRVSGRKSSGQLARARPHPSRVSGRKRSGQLARARSRPSRRLNQQGDAKS